MQYKDHHLDRVGSTQFGTRAFLKDTVKAVYIVNHRNIYETDLFRQYKDRRYILCDNLVRLSPCHYVLGMCPYRDYIIVAVKLIRGMLKKNKSHNTLVTLSQSNDGNPFICFMFYV